MSKGSPLVAVRLSPQLLMQLKSAADALGIPVSDVIRDALKVYLSSHPIKNG